MIEIYAVTALGPIPLATLGNSEWRGMGQNYLKSCWHWASKPFNHGGGGDLRGADSGHRHDGGYFRRDLGLYGLYGAAMLWLVQNRQLCPKPYSQPIDATLFAQEETGLSRNHRRKPITLFTLTRRGDMTRKRYREQRKTTIPPWNRRAVRSAGGNPGRQGLPDVFVGHVPYAAGSPAADPGMGLHLQDRGLCMAETEQEKAPPGFTGWGTGQGAMRKSACLPSGDTPNAIPAASISLSFPH